jgi:hypothetical protein
MTADNTVDVAFELIDKLTKKTDKERKHDRRIMYALAVSFVLDITLTIVLAIVLGIQGSQNAQVQRQNTSISQANISQCELSNQSRAQDREVWDSFIADIVPPGTALTPKVQAELVALQAKIAAKDAIRNCTQVYTGR